LVRGAEGPNSSKSGLSATALIVNETFYVNADSTLVSGSGTFVSTCRLYLQQL
jgi:hypothetical protein